VPVLFDDVHGRHSGCRSATHHRRTAEDLDLSTMSVSGQGDRVPARHGGEGIRFVR
jgi:hypothetical protein